jgi:hypothetical protein
MPKISVGSTIAPYILDKEREYWDRWTFNADAVRQHALDSRGAEVNYFCAIEVDARGLKPYEDAGFMKEMERIGATYWTFMLNDGNTEYHTNTRLVRITTGENLTCHYAMASGADHLLFLAADCAIPDDGIDAMMAIDWPLCGLDVPTYCFHGPSRDCGRGDPYPEGMDVQEHINSAACLFMDREVFTQLRFRVDIDHGLSDDPAFHRDAIQYLGIPTYSRHDKTALHYPECIGAIETRHDDREIHQ